MPPGCAPRDGEQNGNGIVEQNIGYGTVDEILGVGCCSVVVYERVALICYLLVEGIVPTYTVVYLHIQRKMV